MFRFAGQRETRRARASGVIGALALLAAFEVGSGPASAQYPLGGDGAGFDCVIMPSMRVQLASPANGVLASVFVDRGDRVSVGEPLAALDARVQELELELARVHAESTLEIEIAEARAGVAAQRWQRAQQLYEREVVPEENYEEARAEHRLAGLELQQARLNHRQAQVQYRLADELYRQRTMLSPIFGVVVERARSPGEFIYQENHVLVLAQLDPLYVEVSLPVVMYPELVEGMSALVFPEAPFEQPVEATVSVIDRVVDAASATFGVRLELANPQLEVAGGLRCRVMFGLGRAEVSWPEAEPLPRRPSGR